MHEIFLNGKIIGDDVAAHTQLNFADAWAQCSGAEDPPPIPSKMPGQASAPPSCRLKSPHTGHRAAIGVIRPLRHGYGRPYGRHMAGRMARGRPD